MSFKTILITGCSAGGIGAATCLALAHRGHHVFATARTPSKIPEEITSLSNVSALALDVTSDESVAAAVKAVADSGRQLDVVVNNAGITHAMPLLDTDIVHGRQIYETNVWGCIRVIQAFSSLLIASGGRIVNISTIAAVFNCPYIGAYASSKAALNSISETLRLELEPFGVSVVTVLVGIVDSKLYDNDQKFILPPGSRYGKISDIISGWASGASIPQGTSAAVFPEKIVDLIVQPGQSGVFCKGPSSTIMDLVSRFMPQFVTDSFMTKNRGLSELGPAASDTD